MESRITATSVVVLASVLSLASYSDGGSTNSSSSSSPTESSSNYTIAIIPKDATNSWFMRMETGVSKYTKETGLDVFQKGPAETDATMQAQVVQDLIAQGVNAIGVVPVDPGAIEPVLKKTIDAGIVVVTHKGTSQESTMYDIEAFNSAKYGVFIVDNLAAAMGGKGTYTTMVDRVTSASYNEWTDDAIARQKETYPDITLLAAEPHVESQDNDETAYRVTKEVPKEYPGTTGILNTSSFDAPDVTRTTGELGLQGRVSTAGTGMPDANKEILSERLVSALTLWDLAGAGYVMTSLTAKILDREEIEDGIDLGPKGYVMHFAEGSTKVLEGDSWIQITRDNVDSFGF